VTGSRQDGDQSSPFDYGQDYTAIDFRSEPERYRIGKGEQGVLLVEPYKSELLPHWRFRTPELASESAEAIFAMFLQYKRDGDFVGMDMARKFLQVGWTRARRYANHRSGRKYDRATGEELPRDEDPVKAESARIFRAYYERARSDPEYRALLMEWKSRDEDG
jgi:hypothetical protein